MSTPTTRHASAAGAAVLLCALAACASVRPVEEVLGGAPGGAEERDAPAVGERDEEGRLVIASRPHSEPAERGEGSGAASEEDAAPRELPPRPELGEMLQRRIEASDERSRDVLAELEESGEQASHEQLVDAARALVVSADLRVQNAVVFRFAPADLPDVKTLIDAEDDVSSEVKADVRSLAKSSRDLADRALELRGDGPAARLFSTLGTSLYLWSLGPLESLASGAATSLPGRVRSLADDHPALLGAWPLRLQGRFQSRAPWPYRDVEAGVDTLERAVEIAPIPLNFMFLGDARWLEGDAAAARGAWRRAMEARADEATDAAAPAVRELARMRLLASEDGTEE